MSFVTNQRVAEFEIFGKDNVQEKIELINSSEHAYVSVIFRSRKELTVEEVRLLKTINALKDLTFNLCNMTDEHIQNLPKTLCALSLKNCTAFSRLDRIAGMPNLQKLDLFGCTQVTDEMLKPVPITVKTICISKNSQVIGKDTRYFRGSDAGDWAEQAKKANDILKGKK